jgi:hypothetical protein
VHKRLNIAPVVEYETGDSIGCKKVDVCRIQLLASCVRIVEKDHNNEVARIRNKRNEIGTSGAWLAGLRVIINQRLVKDT